MTDRTFLKETEALRDLRALEAIERDPGVSQRELASTLGVAVGVANACVRALVRKGLVKIRGENNRSITYHLTKAGVLAKSKLAVEWTRNTLDFYRQARRDVAMHLRDLAASGIRTVLLDGANELAEIAALVSAESGVRVVAVIADGDGSIGEAVVGIPVVAFEDLVSDEAPDAVVFCLDPSAERVAGYAARFPSSRLFSLVGEVPRPKAVTDR